MLKTFKNKNNKFYWFLYEKVYKNVGKSQYL